MLHMKNINFHLENANYPARSQFISELFICSNNKIVKCVDCTLVSKNFCECSLNMICTFEKYYVNITFGEYHHKVSLDTNCTHHIHVQ